MQILPPLPTFAVTAFEIVCPAEKLRLEAFGRGEPQGNSVTNPGAPEPVTATLRTTASTEPTPALPATTTSVIVSACRIPIPLNWPSTVLSPPRVSRTRPGTSEL